MGLSSGPVSHLLTKFIPDHNFSPIITRAFRPPKPSPAGILHIAAEWGVATEEMIMVGCDLFLSFCFFVFFPPLCIFSLYFLLSFSIELWNCKTELIRRCDLGGRLVRRYDGGIPCWSGDGVAFARGQ